MTTITIYQNRRNEHKYLEVHNDGYYHNSVKQYMLCTDGTRNLTGDRRLHRWRNQNLIGLLEDYMPVIG